MFNSGSRKQAIKRLENSIEDLNKVNKSMIEQSEILYKKRIVLRDTISEIEKYVNTISNNPKEINANVKEIRLSLQNYQEVLEIIEKEVRINDVKNKSGVASGVAVGVGVAAFAPTAAMGIATTFGVASTGTAISTLSGAAATNAALAWLGGGTLIAGGGGMAGGSALLTLAGPVGWVIGGAGILGSGFLMNGKNKKIASEVNIKNIEVKTQTRIQLGLIQEIKNLWIATDEDKMNLQKRLLTANESYPSDYLSMTSEQKKLLGTLVNITFAAVQSLNKTVGAT